MIYWDLKLEESAYSAFLINEEALKDSIVNGIHFPTIRKAISTDSEPIPRLKIIDPEGEGFLSEVVSLGDILIWGVVYIFSEPAKKLILEMGGGSDSDFLQCHFEINLQDPFYMFLPKTCFDVVDFEKSVFKHQIPVEEKEPILFHMTKLVLKKDQSSEFEKLPHCFCVPMPGYLQSLGELFVSNAFKKAWEASKFQGARFRSLSGEAR